MEINNNINNNVNINEMILKTFKESMFNYKNNNNIITNNCYNQYYQFVIQIQI